MARQIKPFRYKSKTHRGKEINFTDFISRNHTKNPEPEGNYEEELVFDAIAQLATVNVRIGRIFNQSDGVNTTNETNIAIRAR